MKAALETFLALLLFAVPGLAAQISGTLRYGNQPVPNVKVVVSCPGNPAHEAQTDASGVYRLNIPETGRCTLQVSYSGQLPSASIYSFAGPTSYDFDLVQQNGQYVLQRR